MVEIIIDYLCHDVYNSTKVTESLINLLCANQTGYSWNAGSPIISTRPSRMVVLHFSTMMATSS
jgi:hypothetical protein